MPEKPSGRVPDYHSFLLRLWRENNKITGNKTAPPIWRGLLIIPDSGERVTFTSLEELVSYLYDLTGISKFEKK